MPALTDDERLSRIMVTDTCWLWMGARYGRYGSAGKIPGTRTSWAAHRWAYEFWHGAIADGLNVLHRCDATLCVHPDHLFLGDHSTNMADMKAKGRARNNPEWKRRFTEDDVRAIRADLRTASEIAMYYGCFPQSIRQIRSGRVYRWVE